MPVSSTRPTFVLGSWQSDFAQSAGGGLRGLLADAVAGVLADADVGPDAVDVVHVGNAAGDAFCFQSHLGGLVAQVEPGLAGRPASRHEAACASGSMAVMAAMADLESGRYGTALVVGAEVLRNQQGSESGRLLRSHMDSEVECIDEPFPWPAQFGDMATAYEERYGLDHAHLAWIGEKNLANARRNPRAQTRDWDIEAGWCAADREDNPLIAGPLRRHDCGRVTDGSAALVLAGPEAAAAHAEARGIPLAALPRIEGWGHATATMRLADKLAASVAEPYVFPHLHRTVHEALARAGSASARDVDLIELHDCFTITEYLIVDHLALAEPGAPGRLIDEGLTAADGALPVNPSGGLIGAGHPVGATGVRMLVDASRQVAGRAGDSQVGGAKRALTVNVGGSCTTVAAFVVAAEGA